VVKQAKKVAIINQKSVERLRTLLDREDLKQYQLADMIASAPETISAIMNFRKPLTSSMANRIIEVFPDYRYEWLMGDGDDSIATKKDAEAQVIKGMFDLLDQEQKAVLMLANAYDYFFDFPREIPKAADGYPDIENTGAIQIFLNGEKISSCSFEQYWDLTDEIRDFVLFKVQRLSKGKEITHAEQ